MVEGFRLMLRMAKIWCTSFVARVLARDCICASTLSPFRLYLPSLPPTPSLTRTLLTPARFTRLPAQIGVSKEVIMSVLLNLSPSMRAVIDEWVPQLSAYVPFFFRSSNVLFSYLVVHLPCTVHIAKGSKDEWVPHLSTCLIDS